MIRSRTTVWLAVSLLAVFLTSAPAWAGSRATVRVLADEDARFAAMVRADADDLEQWLDEDLFYVHSTGAVEGRAAFVASVSGGRIRYHTIAVSEREVVLLSRSAALVRGVGRFTVSAGGEPRPLRLRYVALYGRAGAAWRLRLWQSLQLSPS